jgi:hypothetical protein
MIIAVVSEAWGHSAIAMREFSHTHRCSLALIALACFSCQGELIEDTYTTVFNPASITLLSFLAVAVVVVGLTYNGPLKRQEAERSDATRNQSSTRSRVSGIGRVDCALSDAHFLSSVM